MEPGHCSQGDPSATHVNEFIRIHMLARVALPMKRTKLHSRDILRFILKRIHAEPARPSKILIIDMLNTS